MMEHLLDNRKKTGYWLYKSNEDGLDENYCSLCHYPPTGGKMTAYCDHCGAKMIEVNYVNKRILGIHNLFTRLAFGNA